MLIQYRRYFALAVFLLLAIPLVVGIVRPDSPETILKEGRLLAQAPTIPADFRHWITLAKDINAYLQDHFGLRHVMVRADHDLTRPFSNGNDAVLIGREGRLFYLGDDAVRQSAGLTVRNQRVSDTVAMLTRINAALAARKIPFLVAIPPNGATIYQDVLPTWAQNNGRRTEYDLLLEELSASGVRAVDLRPAVAAARARGPVFYMYDTHWTPRGALAGFNAVVEADSHPDWRIDPKSALGPMSTREGTDLTRMLGVEGPITERAEMSILASEKRISLPAIDHAYRASPLDFVTTSGRPGPTIMILGDSFTQDYFGPMLVPHVAHEISLHLSSCGFDWKAIDHFHPDEVWWMPTERFSICNLGASPDNFAE